MDEQPFEPERDANWPRIRDLGYPGHRPDVARPSGVALPSPTEPPRVPRAESGHTTGLVTICTLSFLHYARVLVESLHRHHPEIDATAVVIDWDGREELPDFGATYWTFDMLGMDRPDWQRLKFSAAHLCYVAKPAAIRALARAGYRKILYFDADIALYAPLDALLEKLDSHRFVVIPHSLAPMPDPERVELKPALGDLAAAGICNAGLVGLVADGPSLAFVDQWEEMVLAPGTFRFHQAEQNALNWVIAFLDGVHVLRDPAYNVAYWNLHDRSLRWAALDGGDAGSFLIDGRPLVAFHFSGLPFEQPAFLSVHDNRSSLYVLPSLSQLIEGYVQRLLEADALRWRERSYRYDRFPSGVRIDERMRQVFRAHELFWRQDLDPFTEEGERYFCRALLLPTPDTFLVPALVYAVFHERGEIQAHHLGARLAPEGLLTWFVNHGVAEYDYLELFDRHRPTLPMIETAFHLAELKERLPVAFADLEAPLGRDRRAFLARLEQAGLPEAGGVRGIDGENWPLTPIWLVWQLVLRRPDLRQNFPDYFESHAGHLADWLEGDGVRRHYLPPGLGAIFLRKSRGRALARVFSFLRRSRRLMERFPFVLIGVDRAAFATAILRQYPADCEFDVDDVVFYLWQMEEQPAAGLAATLDLPIHSGAAPWLLLAPHFEKVRGLGEALARWQAARHEAEKEAERYLAASRRPQALLAEMIPHPAVGRVTTVGPGVNLFGYFKSSIGLGRLSEGLEAAIGHAGWPVRRNVVGNMMMDADLRLADLIGTYQHAYDTNVLVSYPHVHEDLLAGMPAEQTRGRRNIVYLAWEQRDGHPWWRQVYAGFDQVWALSSFAAEALTRFAERPVLGVPPPVDFENFPAAADKASVGLEEGRTSFLYVFDANSSIERKNPAAALRAFAAAFSPDEPVELVMKASNADRLEHRRKLLELVAQGRATGHKIRWITELLPRRDLLRLVSASDCYVSLHRAEGFGYTCAEAMAYGVPVVATGYSGNLEFMDGESAFLVDWKEKEVEVSDGPFQRGSVWAEPDLGHAAHCLRQIYENPAAARQVGQNGSRMVRERLSLERIAGILGKALRA